MKQISSTDITTWDLPEGAIGRLGRGGVHNNGMAFSPDGAVLVVASEIGCWWYDLAAMAPRALWDTERGMVSAISFSHDARWIAAGNLDGIVKIWDSQTLQCLTKINVPGNSAEKDIGHLIFSSNGQYLAAAGRHRSAVYAWRIDPDTPIAHFTTDQTQEPASGAAAFPISFSPDSSLLAYKSDYNATSVLHVETGENIAKFSDKYTEPLGYYELAFSPCGQYLAACDKRNTIHIWNIHNGILETAPLVYGSSIQVIPIYTSDGTLRVAGLYQNEVVIWDTVEKEKVDAFECWGQYRTASCFSNDGTRFAVPNRRGELHVWIEGPPSTVVSLPGHLPNTNSVVFSKDGSTLVSSTKGRTGNFFWNIAQRRAKQIFPFLADHDLPRSSALSPCEKLLATSGRRRTSKVGTIKIWDLVSGTQVAELIEHQKQVYTLAFSPTGEHLISVCGKSIIVWDALCWEKRHSLIGHIDTIAAVVAFHPNGKHLVTASPDGLALLWNVKSGEQLFSFPTANLLDLTVYKGTPQDIQEVIEKQEPAHRGIKAIAFSSCGTLIAGGMQGEIRVWDAMTSETRMAILPPQSCQKQYALAFSPCSRYLASGAWWQEGQKRVSIRLWEIATGGNIHTFWGHPTDVQDLTFSPDGALLASGGLDGTILLWDMEPFTGS
ncbi:MAG: WD40 repeat domain-containing protein [Candidatus Poribacteria bacterium]|nr:WD40 repeat domain-containing protein [Candidatus Poribacteria bacterium]